MNDPTVLFNNILDTIIIMIDDTRHTLSKILKINYLNHELSHSNAS